MIGAVLTSITTASTMQLLTMACRAASPRPPIAMRSGLRWLRVRGRVLRINVEAGHSARTEPMVQDARRRSASIGKSAAGYALPDRRPPAPARSRRVERSGCRHPGPTFDEPDGADPTNGPGRACGRHLQPRTERDHYRSSLAGADRCCRSCLPLSSRFCLALDAALERASNCSRNCSFRRIVLGVG